MRSSLDGGGRGGSDARLALLLGVHPRTFHEWHMGMFLDAVDWVSLPNALGMSQYGGGDIIATKPYCASGHYMNKMSNYCDGCRYDSGLSVGEKACPFTTLYYDFLDRHLEKLRDNPRMTAQVNLHRKREQAAEMNAIRLRAEELRAQWHVNPC